MMRFKTLAVIIIITLAVLSTFTLGYYIGISKVGYREVSESEVRGLVSSIASEVSSIRNLTFKELPNVLVVNTSYVVSTWGFEVPEEFLILGDILKMTLVAPKDYDVVKSFKNLLGMWVAASVGNSVYVVKENLRAEDPLVRRVLAHELTHVLQHQYFKIPPTTTLDEVLATRSLIEGDADVVADTYVRVKGYGEVSRISRLTLEDPFVDIQLIPYIFGWRFVEYLVNVGGWELVNRAYEDVPKSMKYVMFPEKYLVREGLINVVVNVSCDVVRDDVLGPSYIYVMVSKYFNESYALYVSSGWLGDRVVYCVNSTSKILNWVVRWSSNKSADEFYTILRYVLDFNNATLVGDVWLVNELRVSVYVVGDEVLLTTYLSMPSN